MEWNDRRDGSGLRFFDAKPYFPQRGTDMPAVRQPGLFFPNGQPTNAADPGGTLHPLEFGKL